METVPGRSHAAIGIVSAALLSLSFAAWPHGYAGQRIFPTTFEVDDPFVMDEFSLLVSHLKESGTSEVPSQLGTGIAADYTGTITEHWGLVFGGEFRRVEPDGGDARGASAICWWGPNTSPSPVIRTKPSLSSGLMQPSATPAASGSVPTRSR